MVNCSVLFLYYIIVVFLSGFGRFNPVFDTFIPSFHQIIPVSTLDTWSPPKAKYIFETGLLDSYSFYHSWSILPDFFLILSSTAQFTIPTHVAIPLMLSAAIHRRWPVTASCCKWHARRPLSLGWRQNGRYGVPNHQPFDGLLTVCSGANQWKHQTSATLAFVREIHRWPMISPRKRRASNAENVSIWWRHHSYINVAKINQTEYFRKCYGWPYST